MTQDSSNNDGPKPKYKRSARNYLIDSKFQLKYTGIIIGLAVLVSAPLGGFLIKSSREVIEQSERVAKESAKVSDMLRMQIEKDPVYGADPDLAAAAGAASTAGDGEVKKQQQTLATQQKTMFATIVGSLLAMVVLIGLLGIFFTHKVAGPIYKMKLLLRQVGAGKLNFKGGLRKGDELQEFFEEFALMAEKLKARQSDEVAALTSSIAAAEAKGASPDQLATIVAAVDAMKKTLEA
jgi:methyl-accepting chemotaxis protein